MKMAIVPGNSVPMAFRLSSPLEWRVKASILLNKHSESNLLQSTLIYPWTDQQPFLSIFCWKKSNLAASGPKDSTENWLGKKTLPTDTQRRARLLSLLKMTTTSDWLYSQGRRCKESWTV